jgi:hypothetical protein
MKAMPILLTVILGYLCYQPCIAGNPEWQKEMKVPRVSLHGEVRAQKYAAEYNSFKSKYNPSAIRKGPDPCKMYKRKEITGWVLLGVGAGSLAGGGYMLYTGVKHIVNTVNNDIQNSEVSSSGISHRDVNFVIAGSVLSLLGLVLTPTGLGMGISGTVRYHKYCAQGAASKYYISPNFDKGLGVAARF